MVAPWERVVEPLASNAPETVNAPTLVVVTPDAPRVIPEVLVVPILTVPLVVPAPALIETLPPTPPPLFDPPIIDTPAPAPEEVLLPGATVMEVGEVPAAVVISAAWLPARVRTPAVERLKLLPMKERVLLLLPILVAPVDEERVVAPVEDRVVKAAVEGVEAPIAVALIPVEVVLKLPEVMVRLLEPREIEEPLRLERAREPLVAVKLRAPVERVKPFDAVSSWEEVNEPLSR